MKAKVDTNIGRKKKENQKPGKSVKGLKKNAPGQVTLVTLGYPRGSVDGVSKKYSGLSGEDPQYDTVS